MNESSTRVLITAFFFGEVGIFFSIKERMNAIKIATNSFFSGSNYNCSSLAGFYKAMYVLIVENLKSLGKYLKLHS